MIKEIKYNGFSASPGDHEAIEGDLCVAMNLIPEHGTIRPVLPPHVIASIPGDYNLPNDKGRKIVCIHQTSAFRHYIVAIDFEGLYGTPFTYLYSWDPDASTMSRIGDTSFKELHNVEPVGNTLVVLADDGIHYYLWKQGDYHYLGNHLPELDLQFELKSGNEYVSDEHKVEWDITGHPDVFDGWTSFSWLNSDYENADGTITGKDVLAQLRQAVMASLNEVVADVTNDKRFAFPFFVRYGFRMYDESVTMHSAPALMVPMLDAPTLDMGWGGISTDRKRVMPPANIKATLDGYRLHCKPVDVNQVEELSMWSDIISSIDLFVSQQFYTYNQGAKEREIVIEDPLVTAPKNSRLESQICDNGNFYLLAQVRLSAEMPQRNAILRQGGDYVKFDFEPFNDNIVVREQMSDDYGTHDELFAGQAFSYNGRLNLASVSKRLFNGFNPACMWRKVGDTDSSTTTATVVVETDGREIIVQSPSGVVYYDSSSGDKVLWFYYPDPAAKRAYMRFNGDNIELELTPHPMLNGAYFCSLEEDASSRTVQSIPTPSTDEQRIVSMPNKVYTSEVNNPFYFPSTGINSISSGNIMGICAAVRPVSTGQMGYADLYIFADNGIWVAKVNEKGTYSNVTLATGDVCLNPDSITQMETSVLFTTARGIMLVSGSQAQCISEAIDDDGQPFSLQHPAVDDMATMLGLDVDIRPFKDFVQECRMIYDYTGQRIIAYNPDYNYAYIYSLESNKWGMMQSNIDYSVRAYPEAIAVNRDGELMNCSVGSDTAAVNAMLITRPLSLDLPDVQKTVRAVLQRGLFAKRQGHVRSILFASRDMLDWFSMMSSKDEDMRGFSGTGFKWFRVGLLLQLQPHESIQGCSIQFDTKYTNRLR